MAVAIKEELDARMATCPGQSADARMATACPGQSVEAWIQECVTTKTFLDPSMSDLRDGLQHDMEIIFKKYGGPPLLGGGVDRS